MIKSLYGSPALFKIFFIPNKTWSFFCFFKLFFIPFGDIIISFQKNNSPDNNNLKPISFFFSSGHWLINIKLFKVKIEPLFDKFLLLLLLEIKLFELIPLPKLWLTITHGTILLKELSKV